MSKHDSFRDGQGYLYALSNPCFPYLKIGATKNHVDDRRRQLSKPPGVPMPFEVVYQVFVDDYMKAEKIIHTWFHDKHVSKEFFNITVAELEEAVRLTLKPVNETEAIREMFASYRLVKNESDLNAEG